MHLMHGLFSSRVLYWWVSILTVFVTGDLLNKAGLYAFVILQP